VALTHLSENARLGIALVVDELLEHDSRLSCAHTELIVVVIHRQAHVLGALSELLIASVLLVRAVGGAALTVQTSFTSNNEFIYKTRQPLFK
jgi:hypothetical protein